MQNITTGIARFQTGPLRHEVTAGVDVYHNEADRTGFSYAPTRADTLLDPSEVNRYTLARGSGARDRETERTQVGLFASDQI